MSKTVRALFTCREVNDRKFEHGEQTEVRLAAVNEGPFWEATPSGELTMTITAPDAADFFEAGRDYYLDFQLREEPEPAE